MTTAGIEATAPLLSVVRVLWAGCSLGAKADRSGSIFLPDFNRSQVIIGMMEILGIPVLLQNYRRGSKKY